MTGKILIAAVAIVVAILLLTTSFAGAGGERAKTLNKDPKGVKLETATFAAGCFWHVEDRFREVEGVVTTTVGFEGGTLPQPTYKDVCTDRTGHAEVVEIQFDPGKVSYEKLVDEFFELHDPTTLNRQGPDFGNQYRSAIFYHSAEQKAQAEAVKARLEKSRRYSRPIVTEIAPASRFWKAEEYHQQYYEKQRG